MFETADRKGISPLIAAVLLIAFTMAVAAILTAWVTTFTQERTSQVSGQGEQQIDCSQAVLDISEIGVNGSGDANLLVSNSGQFKLTGVTATALGSGGKVLNQTSMGTIAQGNLVSFTYINSSDVATWRVQAGNCPGKSDDRSY